MNNSTDSKWWEIRTSFAAHAVTERELFLFEAIETGARGTLEENEDILCYFEGSASEAKDFKDKVDQLSGLKSVLNEIPDRNWLSSCKELWEEVKIENLTIVPVLQETESVKANKNHIYIYPSTGFGTGHHSTTRMLLLLLQRDYIKKAAPRNFLDLGTGSGILSVALSKLFSARGLAIDNDQLAIENANTNFLLNSIPFSEVSLVQGSLEKTQDKYQLVVANLYAELLTSMAHKIVSATESGCYILLSGIIQHHWQSVKEVFVDEGCQEIECLVDQDVYPEVSGDRIWLAAVFKKD